MEADHEDLLTQAIIATAADYGLYGYRCVSALRQTAGFLQAFSFLCRGEAMASLLCA